MKKLDMGYKNLAPMTFSFEEAQEIAREVWDAYGATAFSAPGGNMILELVNLAAAKQLAAAQGENERLRIALGCTKRDLIRMRCPDFFEGVKDGYENLFDGHLVNMIGLINDYAKQK